ncbi:MAG: MBL fold metallo-hydrolase [Desulfomonilia bacterium]
MGGDSPGTTDHRAQVIVLGSGDAFGSGGRLQPSLLVNTGGTRFLVDCGTTTLIALKRFDLDPADIDSILITHLHGDHFGGIPFLLRETQILGRRSKPLTIAGPAGIHDRVMTVMTSFFPGSAHIEFNFDLAFVELNPDVPTSLQELIVHAYPAIHTPGTHPLSLRVEWNDKAIACSGDTEWHPGLIDAARDADLFVCECFEYGLKRKNHIDYQTLMNNRHLLRCRRIMLTHMNSSMLERCESLELECARDGQIVWI